MIRQTRIGETTTAQKRHPCNLNLFRLYKNTTQNMNAPMKSYGILLALGLSLLAPYTLVGQKSGASAVTQEEVKQIVSYLASDEMAGRDTPSPELQKACEYVRDHFKSLGLKPGGDEGSWFHTSEINAVKQPFETIQLTANGTKVEHFGLYTNGDTTTETSGQLETYDAKDRDKKYSGLVYIDTTQFKTPSGNRRGNQLMAALRRIQVNGGKLVIAKVSESSDAIAQAKRMQSESLVNTRRRVSIPTILVKDIDPDCEIELDIPAPEFTTAKVHNVMGMIPGSDPKHKDEAIIFSAHLDHIGVRSRGTDRVFNGADDNATGVTSVLMLAKAYASLPTPPKRTVIFMTFWGEEKGLLGSRKYAERPTWPLEKTIANINIEMVGRPEGGANGKSWMTGWEFSDLGELMARGAKSADVEIFNHPRFSAMLYRASDNASFNRQGVIAHSFSAGSLHSDYHQVTDEWEKLDLPHMTKVIQGLFAGSLPIANAEVTPVKRGKWPK